MIHYSSETRERVCEILSFTNFVLQQTCQTTRIKTPLEKHGVDDRKLLMEALIGEMRRVMRAEIEQVHERIDRIENTRMEQPQIAPNMRRRGRIQPRAVKVEDEEYYGDTFGDEDDRDSTVGNRRNGGQFRGARNREDNSLGSIKMKIPSF